jgi:hypothetical protein
VPWGSVSWKLVNGTSGVVLNVVVVRPFVMSVFPTSTIVMSSPFRTSILCPEHASPGALDAPKPPEASKLPSIHLGDERFER